MSLPDILTLSHFHAMPNVRMLKKYVTDDKSSHSVSVDWVVSLFCSYVLHFVEELLQGEGGVMGNEGGWGDSTQWLALWYNVQLLYVFSDKSTSQVKRLSNCVRFEKDFPSVEPVVFPLTLCNWRLCAVIHHCLSVNVIWRAKKWNRPHPPEKIHT